MPNFIVVHINIHTKCQKLDKRGIFCVNFYEEMSNHLLRASKVVIADTAVVMNSVACWDITWKTWARTSDDA